MSNMFEIWCNFLYLNFIRFEITWVPFSILFFNYSSHLQFKFELSPKNQLNEVNIANKLGMVWDFHMELRLPNDASRKNLEARNKKKICRVSMQNTRQNGNFA